jgi:cytochrome c oxidase subunit IV
MDMHSASEITYHHAPAQDGKKKIIKTTLILSVLTIIELALGYWLYASKETMGSGMVLTIKGVIVILSLAKAFYIVSIFMHLGDEIRNFIMTILVPLSLFIWFIAAFLMDGKSWLDLRHKYNGNPTEVKKVETKPNTTPAIKENQAK